MNEQTHRDAQRMAHMLRHALVTMAKNSDAVVGLIDAGEYQQALDLAGETGGKLYWVAQWFKDLEKRLAKAAAQKETENGCAAHSG